MTFAIGAVAGEVAAGAVGGEVAGGAAGAEAAVDVGGWGEPAAAEAGSAPSGPVELGHGAKMTINSRAWDAVLVHPYVRAKTAEVAQKIADAANDTAQVFANHPPAEYAVKEPAEDESEARPVRVYTRNYSAMYDDATNSTLLKAISQYIQSG